VSVKLSIVIPALNETVAITDTLNSLQTLRNNGHEIIVVDGGSHDNTLAIAKPLTDKLLHSKPCRALQMNTGAQAATGEILLFLHADTLLPHNTEEHVITAIQNKTWGFFFIKLNGEKTAFRIIEFFINLRSCLTSIATGDQCLFVKRDTFQAVNGYPSLPLMEDVALSKKLRKLNPPSYIKQKAITSSRRWETQGIIRTVVLMWVLRFAYFIGIDTTRLASIYYPRPPST